MEAAYCALCKRGYADLRMQDIADESDRSTAALHYHFDTKHDLLVAFLEYLLDRLQSRLDAAAVDDPVERVHRFLDVMFSPPRGDPVDAREDFHTAILEIRAQAPYDEAYRERLAAFDHYNRSVLQEAFEEGVEAGAFDPSLDQEDTATFVVNAIRGAHTSQASLGQSPRAIERVLRAYVESLRTDARGELADPASATDVEGEGSG